MEKKFITQILKYALENEAEVLCVESGDAYFSIEYLLPDGARRLLKIPSRDHNDLGAIFRGLLKIPQGELTNKKYCRFSTKKYRWDFLLTISPAGNGEKVIIKLAPKNQSVLRLGQLGLEKDNLRQIRRLIKKMCGLILVTSPDNEGKSVTLAALAKEIDKPEISAYWFGNQVNNNFANINFLANNENNWEKILKIDSEVIIIEILSAQDLLKASRAANSGRLVLASLKASSVWQALEAYLKSPGLTRKPIDALSFISNQRIHLLSRSKLKGPSLLKNSRREIGLFECLELTPEIKTFLKNRRNLKNKNLFWSSLIDLAEKNGYVPLNKDKRQKQKNGLI